MVHSFIHTMMEKHVILVYLVISNHTTTVLIGIEQL